MTFKDVVATLVQERDAQGLTAEQVAKKADIGVSAIRNYECGARLPAQDVLQRWAEALGLQLVVSMRRADDDAITNEIRDALSGMDPARVNYVREFVSLATRAEPGAVRGGVAALRGIVTDAEHPGASDAEARHSASR